MDALPKSISAKRTGWDVTLGVVDEKRTLVAHRAILMAASGFFEKMFDGEFVEKESPKVTLGNSISFDVLETLINFVYSGELLPPKNTNPADLLSAADYLQIEEANDPICKLIEKGLDKFNVLQFWSMRSMIKDEELISTIRSFILDNFNEITWHWSFLKMDLETLTWIVESDELVVSSEKEVFRAIQRWINHDRDNRFKHFADLFGCVRYDETMTKDFIIKDMMRECNCTESLDLIIFHLARRLDYMEETDLVVKPRAEASN